MAFSLLFAFKNIHLAIYLILIYSANSFNIILHIKILNLNLLKIYVISLRLSSNLEFKICINGFR